MTQEELDNELIARIMLEEAGMLVKNYPDVAKAMKKYHEAKLNVLHFPRSKAILVYNIAYDQGYIDATEEASKEMKNNYIPKDKI